MKAIEHCRTTMTKQLATCNLQVPGVNRPKYRKQLCAYLGIKQVREDI